MNRRGFLKAILGSVALVALPMIGGRKALAREDKLLQAIADAGKALDDADVPRYDRVVSSPEKWSNKMLKDWIDQATNPQIVWGKGVIASPHTIKAQKDMNSILRATVNAA